MAPGIVKNREVYWEGWGIYWMAGSKVVSGEW